MNSKIASILFDEGIYFLKDQNGNSTDKSIDLNGNPESQVLCLFINDDFSHPRDEELMLAEKIMDAINIAKEKYAWAYSKEALEKHDFEFSMVFLFHSGTIVDKLEFPLNKWIDIKKSKVLRTHSLSDLISDREKKKKLWTELLKII